MPDYKRERSIFETNYPSTLGPNRSPPYIETLSALHARHQAQYHSHARWETSAFKLETNYPVNLVCNTHTAHLAKYSLSVNPLDIQTCPT